MVSLPVCGAFVGRAAEVSALLATYQNPAVHTVLIAGEGGLGKSRLVAEFTSRLSADTVVLTGRCPEFGNGVPYAPFVSVLRAVVRELGVDRLAMLLPVVRPALARWLPELAARAGSAEGEADRIRLFGEILTVLEQLAVGRPVVVVLEDLHWADDSSRELLAFLVANSAQRDLLLVGTYRPANSAATRRLVAGLRRDPGVRLVVPEPLNRHEVGRQLAALYGREPEPGTIARIYERSKGIPLFVEALSTSPEDTPADLSELLLGYQATLPPETQALLRLAAVAGSPVRHTLLESATELDQDALHRALRQLIDQQLLTADDTGYEFRHMLIRDAVYDHLLPAERKRLHARLSQVLTGDAETSSTAALAYHAHAAGELPLALGASWRAAVESAGAHAERLHHLDRVLELWDSVPDAAERLAVDRLQVLEQVVETCYLGGIVERGIAAADEALPLVDTGNAPEHAARLFYRRATLKNQSGKGCGDDLVRASALLPTRPPTLLRGEVLAELAAAQVFSGDAAEAGCNALAAVEVAEQLGAMPLAARAYAYLGLATARSTSAITRPASATTQFASATARPDSATARSTSTATRTDSTAARTGNGTKQPDSVPAQPDSSVACFEKAHAAATAAADAQTLLSVVLWESAVLVAAGDYAAAIAAIQQGLRAAHETFRFAEASPILLVKWAQALTALGRWPEALTLIDESLTDHLPPLSKAALLLSHARIVLAQGDSTAADTSANTAAGLLSDGPWARQYQIQLRTVQCATALALGQTHRAAEIAVETLSADDLAAHHHEVWPLLALAARIDAVPIDLDSIADSLPVTTAVDAAHRADRTAAWPEAVSAWRALNQPYELARSLLGAAESELAEGNRPMAKAALREAATIAADLGATPLLATVRQTADRAGLTLADRSPEPSTASPSTFGLTPRELDVLRLVTRGLSNRQIAAELFISGNTAGVHVSRILTKLGVATRTEAAAAAHTHQLVANEG
ncbi:helix-turn-helix transcriptional regulator [Nocardia sp. XZ_19_369]|uniref:helix-turn-helix transcriptional regulator n=1 Tax=Nocardia sp. XZ_19_369 TaxID=2769487 RepID=UPI00189069EA|nr:helix-turn-helix transcriptional regulator [Nocardia sp. XZ_19_369]